MNNERQGFYDNEFNYIEMHKGEKIICIFWDFGVLKGIKGLLEDIDFYDSITVGGKKIKFLGERTAILYIILDDKIILYSNDKIENYTNHIGHFHNLIEMQEKILGYSVIKEHVNSLKKSRRRK